jgi:hemerythrin-like domain-containing protein
MMTNTQTGRMLDDDHRTLLDLLGRVEQALSRPGAYDAKLAPLLREFAAAAENDMLRHFQFEEEHIFPRLREAGDVGMTMLLMSEHEAIREVATELLPLLRRAAQEPLDANSWEQLRMDSLELVERQVMHIQKETMGLLPALEDLLDPQTDGELALNYAS